MIERNARRALLMFVAVLAALAILYSRDRQAPALDLGLRGHLYYASGSYLGRFDLRDATGTVVADLGEVNVRHVDALADGRLLLSVDGPIHDRLVSRIMRFDPATRDTRTLFGGRAARFVPGAGHVVFERDASLMGTGIGDNPGPERVIAPVPRGTAVAVVPLPDDRLLYAIGPPASASVQLANLGSGETRALVALRGRCDLSDALWLSAPGALLCRAPEGAPWRLLQLDGTVLERYAPDHAGQARLLAAVPGAQAVIYTVRKRHWLTGGTRSSVWALDLSGGRHIEIAGRHYLGESAAVVPAR